MTDLLRTELGYDGVVITDAHNMGAITANYTPGEAALLAIEAGCDLILMPDDLDAALQALRDAAADGTLTETRIDESVLAHPDAEGKGRTAGIIRCNCRDRAA